MPPQPLSLGVTWLLWAWVFCLESSQAVGELGWKECHGQSPAPMPVGANERYLLSFQRPEEWRDSPLRWERLTETEARHAQVGGWGGVKPLPQTTDGPSPDLGQKHGVGGLQKAAFGAWKCPGAWLSAQRGQQMQGRALPRFLQDTAPRSARPRLPGCPQLAPSWDLTEAACLGEGKLQQLRGVQCPGGGTLPAAEVSHSNAPLVSH